MEDKKKEYSIEDLRKLTKKSGIEDVTNFPKSILSSDVVYKAVQGNDPKTGRLPLFLGVNESTGNYVLSFGNQENPLNIGQDEIFYIFEALRLLIELTQKDLYNIENEKLESKFDKVIKSFGGITVAKGKTKQIKIAEEKKDAPEVKAELSDKAKKVLADIAGLSKSESINPKVFDQDLDSIPEEILDHIKDVKKLYDGLSPEDKEAIRKESYEKARAQHKQSIKELEKRLLGEIEIEGEITYDFDYFQKIYDEQGVEVFREEISKIPKEERQEIINKIVESYKQKQGK